MNSRSVWSFDLLDENHVDTNIPILTFTSTCIFGSLTQQESARKEAEKLRLIALPFDVFDEERLRTPIQDSKHLFPPSVLVLGGLVESIDLGLDTFDSV